MDIDPFQALDIAERVQQLDQDLRFIRLDIRPAWRRSILEGLNSPELAAELGVVRQRVVDIEREWRRVLNRPIVDQIEWLAQRAQEAHKRHRLGAHWVDIEADYRATAAALRAEHDIPDVTYGPPPATRQALKQRITEAVRLHQLGRSNFEIARELRVSPYGVSRLLDSKAGKLLMCR